MFDSYQPTYLGRREVRTADRLIIGKTQELMQRYRVDGTHELSAFIYEQTWQHADLIEGWIQAIAEVEAVYARIREHAPDIRIYRSYEDQRGDVKTYKVDRLMNIDPVAMADAFRQYDVPAYLVNAFIDAVSNALEVYNLRMQHALDVTDMAREILVRYGAEIGFDAGLQADILMMPEPWNTPEGNLLGGVFIRARDTVGYTPASQRGIPQQDGLGHGFTDLNYTPDQHIQDVDAVRVQLEQQRVPG